MIEILLEVGWYAHTPDAEDDGQRIQLLHEQPSGVDVDDINNIVHAWSSPTTIPLRAGIADISETQRSIIPSETTWHIVWESARRKSFGAVWQQIRLETRILAVLHRNCFREMYKERGDFSPARSAC